MKKKREESRRAEDKLARDIGGKRVRGKEDVRSEGRIS